MNKKNLSVLAWPVLLLLGAVPAWTGSAAAQQAAAAAPQSNSAAASAQGSASEVPASAEQVEKYLQFSISRMNETFSAMAKPMQAWAHQFCEENKGKVPPDCEATLGKTTMDAIVNMPWQEVFHAEVPIYQRHFTEADIEALNAFYSGPAGQKLLAETPQIAAESLPIIMPIIQRHIQSIQQRLQQQMDAMLKQQQSQKKSSGTS